MTAATRQAFALLGLDITTSPPTVIGVDIFSSESITLELRKRATAVLLTGYGRTYEEGVRHIESQLKDPLWAWVQPLMTRRR